ncbi:MAG: fumarate hydratase [Dehalococcoidia bacterium]|nr:fumarate hydratase [Dehalococcoidia bacterium]
MRVISASEIRASVALLVQKANFELGNDVLELLKKAIQAEQSPIGRDILEKIILNASIAKTDRVPLCQDCGTAVIFLEIGQEVHISGGDLYEELTNGVRLGYQEGFLRKSIVSQPFTSRINTGDNTPPVIHAEIVPGEQLKISFMPKGGGSENMSRLVMLQPSAGRRGIVDAVTAAVKDAGGNPCPPLIIGLGIGSTAEKAMVMSKRALLRPAGQPSIDPEVACLEEELLKSINSLGIGPLGMGGKVTALAVHADVLPCHFASLPLSISFQCHSIRHAEVLL